MSRRNDQARLRLAWQRSSSGLLVVALTLGCSSKPKEAPEAVEAVEVPVESAEDTGDFGSEDAWMDDEPAPLPPPPDVGTAPDNAKRIDSGLAWLVLEPGKGARPKPGDLVTLEFTAWRSDGSMIDSTKPRGRPQVFQLDRLIPGWQDGIKMMAPGEERRFWVPAALAHGQGDSPDGASPAGDLVFDTKLVSTRPAPGPPKTPKDVASIPKDALKSPTGLASRRLRKGTGSEHPTVTSEVTMHYAGWTQDGELFDTSITQGEPLTVALFKMPPGWVEGLNLMVVGEKRRIWMPEVLAYPEGEAPPGQPKGMLVFDVELLAFGDTPSFGIGVSNEAPPNEAPPND
ncbi:MAG: FKBP-type peptidyl-prolyl cis-trans isomerase [Myxococcota bacterium]